MNVLHKIIHGMTNEDIRTYKIYAKRTAEAESRKDLKLFEEYRKTEHPDEKEIAARIYGKAASMNSFHRLKNRLSEEINKSLILTRITENVNLPLYNLHLYSHYYQRNDYQLAYFYWKKSLRYALECQDFELVDMIYSYGMNLARVVPDLVPTDLIAKMRINGRYLMVKKHTDEMLAQLSYRIRTTQVYSKVEMNEFKVFQSEVNKYLKFNDIEQIDVLKIRFLKLNAQILIVQEKFEELSDYLLQNFDYIKQCALFSGPDKEMKIELFIYLINSLNAVRKYHEAIQYAQELKEYLESEGKVYYEKFVYFCYQSRVNAFAELKQHQKALDELEEAERLKITRLNPSYEIFAMINTAICRYELHDYTKAAKTLGRLYLLPGFRQLDKLLKLKVEIAELIIRIEKGDLDLADYKWRVLMKDYEIQKTHNTPEKHLLDIIRIILDQNVSALKSKIAQSYASMKDLDESAGKNLIDYKEWVLSKHKWLS